MKKEKEIKNLSASIRARLTNKSGQARQPFAELLQYYAMERFLYRLGQSQYRDQLILKGALMFVVWRVSEGRATMDIDLLGRFDNKLTKIEGIIKDVCRAEVSPDGLFFDPDTVKVKKIKEGADYEGIRVKFTGFLERSRVPMQVDIGFGDAIYPKPQIIDYPVILDFPKPKLRGYPIETVVAEKFEAMVKLGALNSRMKDFYDVWLMTRQFNFEGESLVKAFEKTFARRKTALPEKPPFFVDEIYKERSDQQVLWRGFLNTIKMKHAPNVLNEVVKLIESFLEEPVGALFKKEAFRSQWKAPGPWQ